MADVFISYKREDRERISPIVNALANIGLDVWFDARAEPGKSFTQEIMEELERCRALVVCWSPAAAQSDYVRGEADIGRQRKILVPVMIERCKLTPPFNMLHTEDLVGWQGDVQHESWRKVLRVLSRHMQRDLTNEQQTTSAHGKTPLPDSAFPEMVLVPPGKFLMGAPATEKDGLATERPRHEVEIGRAFELGKYPVTFAEFDAARAAGGILLHASDQGWGRDRHPLINVSWHDAQAYVAFLNESRSLNGRYNCYRLPSEAEWEYACRALSTTRWTFGDDEAQLDQFAWFSGNASARTHPVGEKRPNAFGLHDMHGNVWEWCEDAWWPNYNEAPTNGDALASGGAGSARVLRGGSCINYPSETRSAHRDWDASSVRNFVSGFRVARTL